jgi:putative hemolysin
MHPITLEVIIILLLILANGMLAMSEMAVVAARKSLLQQRAEDGDVRSQRALELAEEPSRFLSTVQIGITLVGVMTGAFGGATLARAIARQLERWPLITPYSEALGVALVVVGITYFTLVLGELAPKRIALTNPEGIAALVARPLDFLSKLTAPFVRFLTASTGVVLRLVGVRENAAAPVTDEEIEMLLEEGARLGVFEPIEEEIVRQLFRLSDRTIDALITPRPDVVWLDINDSAEEVRRKIAESNHSRYPVADGSLDNVVGQVLVKDLSSQQWSEENFNVAAIMRPALYIPDTVPALAVLERFRNSRSKMAMVIDEFGGLLGVVTVNDLVEAIVGDLPEHHEEIELEAVLREDGSWLIDGMYPLDEFKDLFGLSDLPAGVEAYYQTVGGLVMATLGRVPSAGDIFDWQGLRIEVIDMDARRVDKILAQHQEPTIDN